MSLIEELTSFCSDMYNNYGECEHCSHPSGHCSGGCLFCSEELITTGHMDEEITIVKSFCIIMYAVTHGNTALKLFMHSKQLISIDILNIAYFHLDAVVRRI